MHFPLTPLPGNTNSWKVLTGQVPYHEFPRDATVISKVMRGIKPSRPPPEPQLELSDDIWAVMEECWDHDPAKRPTVDQAADRLHKIPSPQLTMKRMARDQKRRRGDEFQALTPRAFRTAIQGSNLGFSGADVDLLKEYVSHLPLSCNSSAKSSLCLGSEGCEKPGPVKPKRPTDSGRSSNGVYNCMYFLFLTVAEFYRGVSSKITNVMNQGLTVAGCTIIGELKADKVTKQTQITIISPSVIVFPS